MLANEHLFERVRSILHETELIGDLPGCRCSLTRCISIGSRLITTDECDTAMIYQPLRQGLGTAVRQQFDQVVPFEIGENDPIGAATAETPGLHPSTYGVGTVGSAACRASWSILLRLDP